MYALIIRVSHDLRLYGSVTFCQLSNRPLKTLRRALYCLQLVWLSWLDHGGWLLGSNTFVSLSKRRLKMSPNIIRIFWNPEESSLSSGTDEKVDYGITLHFPFWQRQRCTRRGFYTPPHPQKMDKKSRQQTESSFTKCKWAFSIWINSIRLSVCASLKQNKQTKSCLQAESSFTECTEILIIRSNSFRLLYVHYTHKIITHKIVNKPNCILPNVVFSTWTSINRLFVCEPIYTIIL